VSLRTGEARTFTERDPEIVEAVAASAAFPVFFQPVQVGGEWFTDGGLREVTPLGCAIREGATEVVVSTCQAIAGHGAGSGKPSTVALARVALELLLDEVVRGDLRVCALRNELAKAGVPGHKLVKVTAIRPTLDPVANSLVFHPDEAAAARELGYRDAIVAVDT
jgi:NTE family protein